MHGLPCQGPIGMRLYFWPKQIPSNGVTGHAPCTHCRTWESSHLSGTYATIGHHEVCVSESLAPHAHACDAHSALKFKSGRFQTPHTPYTYLIVNPEVIMNEILHYH